MSDSPEREKISREMAAGFGISDPGVGHVDHPTPFKQLWDLLISQKLRIRELEAALREMQGICDMSAEEAESWLALHQRREGGLNCCKLFMFSKLSAVQCVQLRSRRFMSVMA